MAAPALLENGRGINVWQSAALRTIECSLMADDYYRHESGCEHDSQHVTLPGQQPPARMPFAKSDLGNRAGRALRGNGTRETRRPLGGRKVRSYATALTQQKRRVI